MQEVLASLNTASLPFQYGSTAGTLIERVFVRAMSICAEANGTTDENEFWGKAVEFEDAMFNYHIVPATDEETYRTDWVEITQQDLRCVILRLKPLSDPEKVSYFVAGSSEPFVAILIVQFA
jgi:hypothetical protein